ncbi:MAG: response regulator [Candidatus Peribacteraceae bacterium]
MPIFLIADDSPHKMQMLLGVLERSDWRGEILTAETTEEAMKIIDERKIDAAFVDYYIPSALGPAIITHLKSKNPSARIALVTSSPSERVAHDGSNAGAEAVVCTSHEAAAVEKQLLHLLDDWMS